MPPHGAILKVRERVVALTPRCMTPCARRVAAGHAVERPSPIGDADSGSTARGPDFRPASVPWRLRRAGIPASREAA